MSVKPFLPAIFVDSMNMMSPPIGVHAKPIATPGSCVALGDLGEEALGAEELVHLRRIDGDRLGLAFGDAARHLAAQGADLALEVPQPGLARVVPDHVDQAVGREGDLPFVEAVLVLLLRDQMTPCDLELLLFRVAGQLDHLHAVAQRRRNGIEQVGRGHEHAPCDRSNGTSR